MMDKLRFTIRYFTLKRYLTTSLDMTEKEAVQTIGKLRRLDPKVLRAFLQWFQTRQLPNEPLYDVSIPELMEHRQLSEVAAFLAVDWVAKEPWKAIPALRMGYSELEITQEDKDLFRRIAKEKGWSLEAESAPELPEDTSDLSEDGGEAAIPEETPPEEA